MEKEQGQSVAQSFWESLTNLITGSILAAILTIGMEVTPDINGVIFVLLVAGGSNLLRLFVIRRIFNSIQVKSHV